MQRDACYWGSESFYYSWIESIYSIVVCAICCSLVRHQGHNGPWTNWVDNGRWALFTLDWNGNLIQLFHTISYSVFVVFWFPFERLIFKFQIQEEKLSHNQIHSECSILRPVLWKTNRRQIIKKCNWITNLDRQKI